MREEEVAPDEENGRAEEVALDKETAWAEEVAPDKEDVRAEELASEDAVPLVGVLPEKEVLPEEKVLPAEEVLAEEKVASAVKVAPGGDRAGGGGCTGGGGAAGRASCGGDAGLASFVIHNNACHLTVAWHPGCGDKRGGGQDACQTPCARQRRRNGGQCGRHGGTADVAAAKTLALRPAQSVARPATAAHTPSRSRANGAVSVMRPAQSAVRPATAAHIPLGSHANGAVSTGAAAMSVGVTATPSPVAGVRPRDRRCGGNEPPSGTRGDGAMAETDMTGGAAETTPRHGRMETEQRRRPKCPAVPRDLQREAPRRRLPRRGRMEMIRLPLPERWQHARRNPQRGQSHGQRTPPTPTAAAVDCSAAPPWIVRP